MKESRVRFNRNEALASHNYQHEFFDADIYEFLLQGNRSLDTEVLKYI